MSKYGPLKQFLESLSPSESDRTLSFGEVERILGARLPPSAYTHRAWWSNQSSPAGHPHAQAWLAAGWKVDSVSFPDRWVRFRRTALPSARKALATTAESIATPGSRAGIAAQDVVSPTGSLGEGRLLELGFEELGQWFLEGDGLRFRLGSHGDLQDVLYAFVAGGEVRYIGKSNRTLGQRLNGYRRPGAKQQTNLRIHPSIRELLEHGSQVKILALATKLDMTFGGVHVSLAAGLEDALIAELRPAWNVRG